MPSTNEWIDISVPLHNRMPRWPGDPGIRIDHVAEMLQGETLTLTRLEMGAHTGTHMDAPRHFFSDGATIDQVPLDAVIGPARVIQIDDPETIRPDALRPHDIREGERVLFKTQNSSRDWAYLLRSGHLCFYHVNGAVQVLRLTLALKRPSTAGLLKWRLRSTKAGR